MARRTPQPVPLWLLMGSLTGRKNRSCGGAAGGRGAAGQLLAFRHPLHLFVVLCVKGGVGRDIFGEVYRKLQTYTPHGASDATRRRPARTKNRSP